ncbi:MAG: hypothetical protein WCD31_04070 [Gillisia sp.]
MKIFVLFSGLFLCFFATKAQVGIDTSSPQAQLDVVASNPQSPSVKDGILIPRVDKFPQANPSAEQNGMMVFLNIASGQQASGFYFWNNSTQKWETLGGSSTGNFYKSNTTASPNNISDPMFRNGGIGIGIQDLTAKLQVYLNSSTDLAIKKGLDIDNNNPATDNLTTYGIVSDNRSATNGNKYGIKNNVGGIGTGIHYGIFNESYQNTGTNDIYGIFNRVGKTFGANSSNYGIYSEIGTIQGQGTIYGIYSSAFGNSSSKVYAGYFVGKVGIGLTPAEEYILPSTRGKDEQILSTDASGNVNWTYNNKRNYSSTASVTGDYIIPDEVSTLRINNTVASITLPQASLNKGRTLILIAWDITNSNPKPINFLNGDDLFDVINNTQISSIAANTIYTIQSAGNRWIVINTYKKTP